MACHVGFVGNAFGLLHAGPVYAGVAGSRGNQRFQAKPLKVTISDGQGQKGTKQQVKQWGDNGMHAPEPEAEAMATDEIDSSILPNLDQVFAISGPLVKYVPRVCRCIWAEVVLHELSTIISRNNNGAWTRFFMLAKCCMWQPR